MLSNRIALMLMLMLMLIAGCRERGPAPAASGRLTVVATIFPVYDFARAVAGDKAEVKMLLPPGMESHSFEPRPDDMVTVNRADLFIYTSPAMEPWAVDLAKGAGSRLTVVDAGRGSRQLGLAGSGHGYGHRHDSAIDPHIWLDFKNAQMMVNAIAQALAARDPANQQTYLANAAAYRSKLEDLDRRYREGLTSCAKREFLHGGHYAFGYLADCYGLSYEAAYAASANAEPTPARLVAIIKRIKGQGLKYIFTEELLDPRTAETIARETGVGLLRLNGAHTVSQDDFAKGVTFLTLMEQNLVNLRTGLQCR